MKSDLIKRLEYVYEASMVTRYHTRYTIQKEAIGQHSHGVAIILCVLYPNCTSNLLKAAILHDMEEFYTGDMPADTKRALGLRQVFADYGDQIRIKEGIPMPFLTEWEQVRLKFADMLQGALFCIWELEAGNKHILGSFQNYVSWMHKIRDQLEEHEKEVLDWVQKIDTDIFMKDLHGR